jgi:hypothetical protein
MANNTQFGGAIMQAHTHQKIHSLEREKGQGLVEMVLILPFLMVLLVGVVELGVALNRQLTVVNAAREGARFGAFGATADDIHAETLSATSDMFDFTEENAVVVVINATTNDTGTGFTEWITNTYPADATIPHVTQGEVLEELQADGADATNVKLVVVDVRYDHESMLGLPFVGAAADQIPIGSWTVMRLAAPDTRARGDCCLYPIALDTVTVNWPTGWSKGTEMEDIRVGDGPGMFGWLYWDPDNNGSAVNLEYNLRNACTAPSNFKNACDPEDTTLDVGDWISGDSGQSVADGVRDAVEELEVGQRYINVPVWDQFEACNDMPPECDCHPGKQLARLAGFATVDITEVSLTGSPKTISAKFIAFNTICE